MSKIRDLPEIVTLADNDILYVVDSSEGVNGGRKILLVNLKAAVALSPSEVKSLYESNPNTNAFTDAEQSKLSGIESGATADQDAEEVPYDNSLSNLDSLNVRAAIDELDSEKEPTFTKNSAFNKNFGSTTGTVVEGNDLRLSTAQKLTVKKNPGAGQFSSIKAAVDSISDASALKPYLVDIGPGIYEEDIISLPSYVFIRGERSATVIRPLDPNNDIFVVDSNCGIAQVRLEGAIGTNATAIRRTGGTTDTVIESVEFGDNYCFIAINSTGGSPTVIVRGCRIDANVEFQYGFDLEGTGSGALIIDSLTGVIVGAGINPTAIIYARGSTNEVIVNIMEIRTIAPASLINGLRLEDGVRAVVAGMSLLSPDVGINIPNVGAGPVLNITNSIIVEAVNNPAVIENPNTTGFLAGAWKFEDAIIEETASQNMNIVFTESEDSTIGLVAYGDIIQGLSGSKLLNISKLNREEATLGHLSGGTLTTTATPLQVNITSGNGFLVDSGGDSREVSWETTNLILTPDTSRYITVNENGIVQAEAGLPNNLEERIILGRVLTGDTQIVGIDVSRLNTKHHGNLVERYLRNTFGAIFASGCLVTENGSTDRSLDVTGGEYFFGTTRFTPAGGAGITFTSVYRDGGGGFTTVPLQTVISNSVYDDGSGTPTAIPTGHYAKGVLIGGGDGVYERYAFVMAQETFANQNDAVAADLPQLPPQVGDALTIIAAVIIQEGSSPINEVIDVRPRPGFAAAASGGGSDHGGLTGLTDDDHPQYLLTNGGRVMTGNLNLGTNNIVNVGTINGIAIAAHASRHLPNGLDPLATAAPLTNLNGNTANTLGTANSFARSDHTHEIDNATTLVSGLMSASDKTKLNGIESGATADQNADEVPYNNSGSTLSATDVDSALDEIDGKLETNINNTNNHVNGGPNKHDATEIDYERVDGSKVDIGAGSDTVEAGLTDLDDNKLSRSGNQPMTGDLDMGANNVTNVGTVDGVDVSAHGSRHNPDSTDPISTAAAVTLGANSTNQEGSAGSVARSDHTHDLATGAPSANLTGDTTNAEGASNNLARADHSHAISTGTPAGSLGANSTNTPGSSPNLVRSDHTHDLATGVVSTQNADQANAEGASNNLARADHTHNIPTAAPVNVGAANAQGSAGTFSKSDHVHNVFPIFSNQDVETTGNQSSTSGAFVQTQTMTTPNLPAGRYKIEWYMEVNVNSTTADISARVQLNNIDNLMEVTDERQDAVNFLPYTGFAFRNLSGINTIDMDFSNNGGANVTCRKRRLCITRVS